MTTRSRTPSRALLVTEAPRAGLDFAALLGTWPLLAAARRGDGHPVLVLPGLLTGDPATVLLRNVLRALGTTSRVGALARIAVRAPLSSRSCALGSSGSTTTRDGG